MPNALLKEWTCGRMPNGLNADPNVFDRVATFGADFSYQMLSGTKKSAPKINIDDA